MCCKSESVHQLGRGGKSGKRNPGVGGSSPSRESLHLRDLSNEAGLRTALRQPAVSAASSLVIPCEIRNQNRWSADRLATGGRPGDGKGARPKQCDRRFRRPIATSFVQVLRRPLESNLVSLVAAPLTLTRILHSLRENFVELALTMLHVLCLLPHLAHRAPALCVR